MRKKETSLWELGDAHRWSCPSWLSETRNHAHLDVLRGTDSGGHEVKVCFGCLGFKRDDRFHAQSLWNFLIRITKAHRNRPWRDRMPTINALPQLSVVQWDIRSSSVLYTMLNTMLDTKYHPSFGTMILRTVVGIRLDAQYYPTTCTNIC